MFNISPEIIKTLKNGGVGVMPTDTIYGLVCRAEHEDSVKRIYEIKKRTPKKPLIILISKLSDLNKFDIKISPKQEKKLKEIWPDKVSVILPTKSKKLAYLDRGTKTLAFRLPKPEWLRSVINKTGPLVAPSANPEGLPPAKTIKEAKNYFGDNIDFYLSAGRHLSGAPSTVIKFDREEIIVVRK